MKAFACSSTKPVKFFGKFEETGCRGNILSQKQQTEEIGMEEKTEYRVGVRSHVFKAIFYLYDILL